MNKTRRKQLSLLQDRITHWRNTLELNLSEIATGIDSIQEELETLRDEEEESRDALPESLQDGERGLAMEEAVSRMDTANEALLNLFEAISFDAFEGHFDEAFEAIEEAKGAA